MSSKVVLGLVTGEGRTCLLLFCMFYIYTHYTLIILGRLAMVTRSKPSRSLWASVAVVAGVFLCINQSQPNVCADIIYELSPFFLCFTLSLL